MDAALGSVDAGYDCSLDSQPAAPLPLSQLLPPYALPGISQLYAGLLPLNTSEDSALRSSQPAAASRVGGFLGLPLHSLAPLPPPPLEPLPPPPLGPLPPPPLK